MSTISALPDTGTAPSTLLELLERYTVEIPIVQRDYAQGRMDGHVKAVRAGLLRDMKRAVLGVEPLDLNFVYGKAEGGKFIPIDGQQRLTTLFLLHLYAFRDDGELTGRLQRFTYKTRPSSREFLKKLVEHRAQALAERHVPSQEIEDASWFASSWRHDPTVRSALVMLDAIAAEFRGVEGLAARLSASPAPITFQFLDMPDLGMEDSLYIKLNARGRPLTSIENFKARLLGRMKQLGLPDASQFERSFDGPWTDLFWSRYKLGFDRAYHSFFGVLLMGQGIVKDDKDWSSSLDHGKIGAEIFEIAACTLDYLADGAGQEIQKLMFGALKEDRTYTDRVLFHAVSVYLLQSARAGKRGADVDTASLSAWVRIFKDLALNTDIDRDDRYRRAIEGVDALAGHWDDIIPYFRGKGPVTGFNQQQIEEEQIKAAIVDADPAFAEKLYEAEAHSYFSGQIRAALYPAKQPDGTYLQASFERYWAVVSKLFDPAKPHHGHLLRQALLTLGDYTLDVSAYKTLCVDDPKELGSTPSMKRLFSNCGPIVRQLLDRLDPARDLTAQLEQMVERSQVPGNDWRYCFIRYPALFRSMHPNHLRLRELNGQIHIIRNKAANGYNWDLFLAALQKELEARGRDFEFDSELGTAAQHYLFDLDHIVRSCGGAFQVTDLDYRPVFTSSSDTPIQETADFICPSAP